jgi:hypothetical protein
LSRALFYIPLFYCLGFWLSGVDLTAVKVHVLASRRFELGFGGDISVAGGRLVVPWNIFNMSLMLEEILEDMKWVESIQELYT